MELPAELRYTAEHEWVRDEGDEVTVGITDFAQEALGDVVFVEPPSVGVDVAAGDACGEIESTKSVSVVYVPVSGTVTAVNEALDSAPELLNSEPYGQGWLFRLRPSDRSQLDTLLDAEAYRALTSP